LKPAVASGDFVLCDRYSDSTEAYQRAGRGLDSKIVEMVDALARDGLTPELTLLYDLQPEAGLERARGRDGPRVGRFEAAEISFHRAVRQAYLEIARREPGRVALIGVDGDAARVFAETWRHFEERFSP
jgi:dTMP kinase